MKPAAARREEKLLLTSRLRPSFEAADTIVVDQSIKGEEGGAEPSSQPGTN